MKCLFIGGAADGQMLDMSDPLPEEWRVPTHREWETWDNYRQKRIGLLEAYSHREWFVYILDAISEEDAIDNLITGYHKEGK